MAKSISHQLFFPHPPELVWEYLTTAELIAQWLMPNDFQPVVGHEFQFRTRPMPNLDFDGIVYCKVLEMVPPRKLSYSWKGGPGDGSITIDSVVHWNLSAKNNGTELSLEHTGFERMENATIVSLMDEGWLKNMKKIAELIKASRHGVPNS
jgi:uncharacterized protein YndB with AHSA1/START domain